MFKNQIIYLRAVANLHFHGDIKLALKHACNAYPKFKRQIRGIANLFFKGCLKLAARALKRFLV